MRRPRLRSRGSASFCSHSAPSDSTLRAQDRLSLGLSRNARSRNSKRARLQQSQSRQTGPFRVLFASPRFLPALRAHGSSCRLRAAGAYEIEAGGPVCKTTSSARRKHLRGSCSPPFLPDHGPVTQSSLPPSLTCPPIGSGISQDLYSVSGWMGCSRQVSVNTSRLIGTNS